MKLKTIVTDLISSRAACAPAATSGPIASHDRCSWSAGDKARSS